MRIKILNKNVIGIICLICFASCHEAVKRTPPVHELILNKEDWDSKTAKNLKSHLKFAIEVKGKLNDTISFQNVRLLDSFYRQNDYALIWSIKGSKRYVANSLSRFIENAKLYGLFPSDYHYALLKMFDKTIATDSLSRLDATLWTKYDLVLTDAYFDLVKDLKQGRLPFDTLALRKDTVLSDSFYIDNLRQIVVGRKNLETSLQDLEPKYAAYDSIKAYIPAFLDSAKFIPHTTVAYPYSDSIAFLKQLQQRLSEDTLMPHMERIIDTMLISQAIKKFQQKNGMKETGKWNDALIRKLNSTDFEKFKKIAINLDRFKLLPDSLPPTRLFVNLPSYKLTVSDSGNIVMESRVIVGAPKTRTPELRSDLVNFITYPQWTVPYSIIFKEMLPAIQKNVDYLAKQNLMVVDKNDSIIDPVTVNWKKLNKNHFPYLIKQKQGDDNSLGVIKFNFRNKYDVYMHDTNARWLFGKSQRALSHGCVRVQQWKKLADFLLRNNRDRYPDDTLKAWIKRQEKHVVTGFQKVPVLIRYFTVEGTNGKLKFYDDIYGDDSIVSAQYFSKRKL